jgi:hypothetical protein
MAGQISFNAGRISLYAGQISLNDGTHRTASLQISYAKRLMNERSFSMMPWLNRGSV